jgi:hypothetical protein
MGRKSWKPQPPRALRAYEGLYRDSVTFTRHEKDDFRRIYYMQLNKNS